MKDESFGSLERMFRTPGSFADMSAEREMEEHMHAWSIDHHRKHATITEITCTCKNA